jgi:hypothetical protein
MALEELKSTYGDDGTLEKWFGKLKNSETPKSVDDGLKNSTYSKEPDVTNKNKDITIERFTAENGYTTQYKSDVEIKSFFKGLGTQYTSPVEIVRFNPENGYKTQYTSGIEINAFHKGIDTQYTEDILKSHYTKTSFEIDENFGDGLAKKGS